MIPVIHTFEYRAGSGRRNRKGMLSSLPELNGYIIFLHDAEHKYYWIYDEEATQLAELFDAPIHYDSDGNPGIRITEDTFAEIQRELNEGGYKYAVKKGERISAIDFVLPQTGRAIGLGTSFFMSDGETEKRYILAPDDYTKTTLVWRTDGTYEVLRVRPRELHGYTPLSPESPIGTLVMSRHEGDHVSYAGSVYTITRIV